jgi:hypothetical protein
MTADTPVPVHEIERRMRWPAPAVLAFLGFLITLLVMASLPWIAPPRVLEGMPDDPGLRSAAAAVRGVDPLRGSGLAFASALFGTELEGVAEAPVTDPGLVRVRIALEQARGRLGRDPRLAVFFAHLDLAEASEAAAVGDAHRVMLRLRRAEGAYRGVADGRTEVPESRIGLGALLAFRALREPDPERRRGLRLKAIAQFAAVQPHDRIYPTALFDRALLLSLVDRTAEARQRAAELSAREGQSPRARALQASLEQR